MRWKEEVTLTAYEMQWTVWYFSYMSQKWILPQHIFKSPVSFTKAKTAHSHFLKNVWLPSYLSIEIRAAAYIRRARVPLI